MNTMIMKAASSSMPRAASQCSGNGMGIRTEANTQLRATAISHRQCMHAQLYINSIAYRWAAVGVWM